MKKKSIIPDFPATQKLMQHHFLIRSLLDTVLAKDNKN